MMFYTVTLLLNKMVWILLPPLQHVKILKYYTVWLLCASVYVWVSSSRCHALATEGRCYCGLTGAPLHCIGASLSKLSAGQAGSAAVWWAEEGRAQRHCGQEAARITLRVLGGEWHPLEWRRAVCGDVRRRKNLVNLTKRLRNIARTVGGRIERDALFTRGTHTDGFYDILHRTTILLYLSNTVAPPFVAANFIFSWQVRCSGTLDMICALKETWWRGGKFLGERGMVFRAVLEG